jgi:phosphoribosylformylglycinamidine cyclo-ligase
MIDYRSVGVDSDKKEGGLARLLAQIKSTFDYNLCKPLLPVGYYANVIDLRPAGFDVGIAFATDGVGTKILVAEQMQRYDTVGIDCVAMNVNDILCVGATPVSMVDYIAVSEANPDLLEKLAQGLRRGCELAGVNLPGGEIAQVAELLSKRGDAIAFDLIGTAIGIVSPNRILIGQDLQAGDLLIGIESSGLHSNGYTLARKVCFEIAGLDVDHYSKELGRTIGEELLEPTRIYVREVLEILTTVPVKALFHITGDGLFNLTRSAKAVGYRIEKFPDPPPIFHLLQKLGQIPDEEMFRVFNMGIGFILVVPDDSLHVKKIQEIVGSANYKSYLLGHVEEDPNRTIWFEPKRLKGCAGRFVRQ